MGDEVRVTVIAAGFDRWEEKAPRSGGRRESAPAGSGDASGRPPGPTGAPTSSATTRTATSRRGGDDEFDVPSFLK